MLTIFTRSLVLAMLVLLPITAGATTWEIDPVHTTVGFKVRHLMVSYVKGVFTNVVGTINAYDDNLEQATLNVVIDPTSIDTNNQKRDDHLRSEDFLYVEKYPTMTFNSKRVVVRAGLPVQVIGDLTIRGVTREVPLEIEEFTPSIVDPWGKTRRGATASTTINRKDFGLTWNKVIEAGGVTVGDDVMITLEVEMTRQ